MKKNLLIILSISLIILIGLGTFSYFYINPEIKIKGEKEIVLNIGESYKEEGATTDILGFNFQNMYNVKGQIDTNKTGEYVLEYKTDTPFLHKKGTNTRIIHIVDKDAPTITLKGDNITLFVGDKYTEPGYQADDTYDGNLTDKVKIKSNLDTKNPGTYTIEYTVIDSSNNITTSKRDIIVKERPTPTTTTTRTTSTNSQKTNKTTTKKVGKSKSKGVAILMYHYFYDEEAGETGKNSNYMEIHDFEQQMKYLKDNNYYFPSWKEIADFVDGKISLPTKSIVITIDDGQYTFFNLALPILNKYNIKATPFIITSKAGGKKVKKYQYSNIDYQSHTHNMHTGGCKGGRGGLFRCIDHDKGVADLKKSISIVGSSDAIAYPFGDVTENTLKITKDAGFKVGVTIKYGKAKPGMDRYQLPRIRMYKGMSLSGFKNSI